MAGVQPTISFMVACYNEEDNITGTLDTLLAACAERDVPYEILIMDDGSRDRSVEILNQYIQNHPTDNLHLHINTKNMGLGYNYFEGAFLCSGEYYRLVCGDNVEPKETFLKVLDEIGESDIVAFFYPVVPGKPRWRCQVSNIYTHLINLLSGYHLHYYNGLAIHRRYNVMRWNSQKSGFGFQADLIVRVLDAGASLKQVSLEAHERESGHSSAYTLKNFLSVAHFLVEMVARRLVKRFW